MAQLDAIKLTKPPKAPADGTWTTVSLISGDGDKSANYKDKTGTMWLSVRFLDCRSPSLDAYDDKSTAEQGQLASCYTKGSDKLKGFPLEKTNKFQHVISVGNIAIISGIGMGVRDKVTDADIDTFLGSLDLGAIAKL